MHVSSWCQTFLLYEPWGMREIVVRLNLIGGQNGGYMSFPTSLKFKPLGHMWRPINIQPSRAVGMTGSEVSHGRCDTSFRMLDVGQRPPPWQTVFSSFQTIASSVLKSQTRY